MSDTPRDRLAVRNPASHRVTWALAISALYALAGCTTTSPYTNRTPAPQPPAAQVPRTEPAPRPRSAEAPVMRDGGRAASAPAPAPAPAASTTSPATAALLEQSRRERADGRYGAAASALERALRIAPNDGALWVELAEVRLDEGDRTQAETLARKALTLTGADRRLATRAERVIAAAAACAGERC